MLRLPRQAGGGSLEEHLGQRAQQSSRYRREEQPPLLAGSRSLMWWENCVCVGDEVSHERLWGLAKEHGG